MAPSTPRLRVLSVGGNPLSAFLSWRLQATHSCDVTLVWKTTYETVSQYGISFKSSKFGNERFKPHAVVRTPEEAGTMPGGFDYVLLSVKALPDVYDLASIIESVVTPQHTCILVNTTTAIGTEAYLESRYPTNVVLSLVSGVALSQLGNSEFEHTGGSDIWVGSAIENTNIPESIQYDMADALALTLHSGSVDCHVSSNIRQQQWERMLGPIAFHPLSVIMDCPNLTALMEKSGCRQLITDLIDELIAIAKAQKCSFPENFKQKTIEDQMNALPAANIMHQDFVARRPLEVETFLGSPIKAAKPLKVSTPHLNTLYPILSHMNQQNQTKPPPHSPSAMSVGPPPPHPRPMQGPPPPQRLPPGPSQGQGPGGPPPRRPPPNGRGGLDPSMARRPPPSQSRGMPPNGYPPRANGDFSPRPVLSRRNSFDDDLEEFGHIALYGDMVDSDAIAPQDGYQGNRPPPSVSQLNDLALRERELALREREQLLREQEMKSSRSFGLGRKKNPGRSRSNYGDDDDDDDFFVDPNQPPMPTVNVDNFDMMSVTSRRNRRLPSTGSVRNPGSEIPMQPSRGGRHSIFNRNTRNRASARLMNDVPGLHDPITDNALMGYSSNRYGTVDRKMITDNSRANSMTSQRGGVRDDPAFGGGAYPPMPNGGSAYPPMPNGGSAYPPMSRRLSTSPGDTRNSNGYGPRNGHPPDQRGYRGGPPDGQIRQPIPKHAPGQNGFPHQVEQHISDGVRQPSIMKGPSGNQVRSTTGSASASLSNDSGSASTGGETSAYSSSSSLEKRMPNGVTVG
ncbi:ketopantoate reductase PanE/ApbA C terminal-domain-containing protein [Trichophaea hybrida]|nr:ketopantoate reductase PanE/ApbA C terminal-domain-containing protein [Trichophaea hybrida]